MAGGHNVHTAKGHNVHVAKGHNVKATSWVTVALIIVASVLFGFALPTRSIALTVAGGVVLLAGIVMGIAFRIMDDAY